ncbi:MAG: HlyD family efflux transporter periplasmic adaptor subunit [Planctomycetota bacterium]
MIAAAPNQSPETDKLPRGEGLEPKSSSMLTPIAYDELAMPALQLARSSRMARRIGQLVFVALIAGTILVVFAPWQQSVRGLGNVVAFAPESRQQELQAPIKGRIQRLGEGIIENARVKEGTIIAEISDIDPMFLDRLEGQLEAVEGQVDAAKSSVEASRTAFEASETVVESQQNQVTAYTEVKEEVVAGAIAAIASAKDKLRAEEQQLEEQKAALVQIELDYTRQKGLHEKKIISDLKFQEMERKKKETEAKVRKSEAYVSAAGNTVLEKERERNAKEQKAQADIEYATVLLRKARADVGKAKSDLAKATSEYNKANKELLDTQSKLAQQQQQSVTAPFDGILTSITPNLGSQMLKPGDPIATIVPDTDDRAVQVWLDGNDAPLVEPGRHVRLQFEGWPAVQFAGWPSVAVGTFGGTVVSRDPVDDGKGKFRILVRPDENDHEWPKGRFLSQGVRVNAWVLLERVPLWFEIWRNMNGFPQSIDTDGDADKKPGKVPKLPKA